MKNIVVIDIWGHFTRIGPQATFTIDTTCRSTHGGAWGQAEPIETFWGVELHVDTLEESLSLAPLVLSEVEADAIVSKLRDSFLVQVNWESVVLDTRRAVADAGLDLLDVLGREEVV